MEQVMCPVCDADIGLQNDTEKGELLDCDDCGSELEVTGVSPYALAEAPQTEEDWGE